MKEAPSESEILPAFLSRRSVIATAVLTLLIVAVSIGPIRRALISSGDPGSRALALGVLPFLDDYEDPDSLMLIEGFSHYVGNILSGFEQFYQPLWSTPYWEIAFFDLDTSEEVAEHFSVNQTVRPRVVLDGDNILVTVTLEDARTGQ